MSARGETTAKLLQSYGAWHDQAHCEQFKASLMHALPKRLTRDDVQCVLMPIDQPEHQH